MDSSSETIKGYEILEFENAEMTKCNGSSVSQSSVDKGPLKVFYFPDMSRFVLMLNDLAYPLLHRLTITCEDKSETQPRSYILPCPDSQNFLLKLNKIPSPEAIKNFETILSYSSRFFFKGEMNPVQEGEMSPTNISTETSESFSGMLGSSEGAEGRYQKDPVKKGIFAKAAGMISKVLVKGAKNMNMSTTRTIDQLKDTSPDTLTVCEFPRDMIEEAISTNMRITGMNPSVRSSETQVTKTMIKKVTVNYPREIIEGEQRLIEEIRKHRELQDKEREKVRHHQEKEIGFINRERVLQDELNDLRLKKMKIEIEQRENIYSQTIVEKDRTLQQQEGQFARDRQDFINREKTLTNEIKSRIEELRKKEKLTQEEEAEFAKREKELLEVTRRLEGERSDMEKRHETLKNQAQVREVQIKDKERGINAERDEFKKKEESLQRTTEMRLKELREKEKMTEEERAEFKRKQDELNRMNKAMEQEMVKAQEKQKKVEVEGDRKLAELRKKEQAFENERTAMAQRAKELEAEASKRLDDLRKKQKLTDNEMKELQKRESELNSMRKKTEADQMDLKKQGEELTEKIRRKENALLEKEKITENERQELKDIKQKLKKDVSMTETERKNLESMKEKIMREAEQRQAELSRREKLTEDQRKSLQRQEQEAEAKLQARLGDLRQKEKLTEQERVEMRQRQEELVKLTKIKEMESENSKKKLQKLRQHEDDLIAQNQTIIQGHKRMQEDVDELERELNKPGVTKVQVEKTTVTDERLVREKRVDKSGMQVPGFSETTTSG